MSAVWKVIDTQPTVGRMSCFSLSPRKGSGSTSSSSRIQETTTSAVTAANRTALVMMIVCPHDYQSRSRLSRREETRGTITNFASLVFCRGDPSEMLTPLEDRGRCWGKFTLKLSPTIFGHTLLSGRLPFLDFLL